MRLKDRYLVVVAIINGRNFPIKSSYSIIAEAKFDKEVLSTDPVDLSTDHTKFEQELAWELSKRTLRDHKLQRTSIKLQFYLIDSSSPVKEPFGYVILDVRSASSKKQFKWVPILNTNQKTAPEIFCCVYIDGDGYELVSQDVIQTAFAQNMSIANLNPVKLKTNSPTYSIGPKSFALEVFKLEFCLKSISNIIELIPTNKTLLNLNSAGITFHLKWLHLPQVNPIESKENYFTSPLFSQLGRHEFDEQIYVVKIHSTVDILKLYFAKSNILSIDLFSDDIHIGRALVDLKNIMSNVDHAFSTPALLDIVQEFHTEAQPESHLLNEFLQPTNPAILSIHVSLSKDKSSNLADPVKKDIKEVKVRSRSLERETDLKMNHFTLVIDFTSIRWKCDKINSHSEKMTLSFFYEKFGMKEPVNFLIPKPIEDYKQFVPESTYKYEFISSYKDEIFSTEPLTIYFLCEKKKFQVNIDFSKFFRHEGITNDDGIPYKTEQIVCLKLDFGDHECELELTTNLLLGDLGSLPFTLASKQKLIESKSSKRRDRTHSNHHPKVLGDNSGRLVRSQSLESTSNNRHKPARKIAVDDIKSEPLDIRDTNEYKAAYELEMWKSKEEERFMKHLHDHEQFTMNTIAQEWHQRDMERESICKRKLKEYQLLEEQTRKLLLSLTERERRLCQDEANFKRIQRDIQHEEESKRKQFQLGLQRKIKQAEQMVQLEKQQTEHWKNIATESQSRITHLEKDVARIKTQKLLNRMPVVPAVKDGEAPKSSAQMQLDYEIKIARLDAEISQNKAELSKLECRLSGANLSTKKYRQMWARALDEVSSLRQLLDAGTQKALEERDCEIRSLRAMLSVGTGIVPKNSNNSSLKDLRKDFEQITEEVQISPKHETQHQENGSEEFETIKNHIERILVERHGLLDSGVYDLNDEIIKDIDQEIQDSLSKNKLFSESYEYKIDENGKGFLKQRQ